MSLDRRRCWGDALTHKPPLRLGEEGLAAMIDADAFNAFEAAGWNARALEYDHYWPALTRRLSDPLLDAVGAGHGTRVVDVACGPGYLAGRAAERGAMAVGVDIAEPMIRLAQRRFPRAEFRQGDAQALPFPDRCFDAVVANLGLPHFGQPEQAVGEFRRVLTPGGRVALTAWNHPAHARLVGVLLEAVHEVGVTVPETVPAGPNFFRFADDAELESLLEDQDFIDIGIRTVEFVHSVDSADELWDGLLYGTVRTAAVVRAQPDDVIRQIRAGFNRRVEGYRTGPTYRLPVSFKLAHARLR
ncbi:class I SAM-dependent methyltransferase [Mycobacterium sp.]|uniref:class I SAM-dependent methyltransferase n=1 Tax=Mycobacterium sp. TaxID=1785 RepID=UPI002C4D9C33|nr:methyltransferase domain-containing protein [Mycobacterium sp.]HTH87316.1 methyltransferase domain-containing protein [Mycobacterium sp.]